MSWSHNQDLLTSPEWQPFRRAFEDAREKGNVAELLQLVIEYEQWRADPGPSVPRHTGRPPSMLKREICRLAKLRREEGVSDEDVDFEIRAIEREAGAVTSTPCRMLRRQADEQLPRPEMWAYLPEIWLLADVTQLLCENAPLSHLDVHDLLDLVTKHINC